MTYQELVEHKQKLLDSIQVYQDSIVRQQNELTLTEATLAVTPVTPIVPNNPIAVEVI